MVGHVRFRDLEVIIQNGPGAHGRGKMQAVRQGHEFGKAGSGAPPACRWRCLELSLWGEKGSAYERRGSFPPGAARASGSGHAGGCPGPHPIRPVPGPGRGRHRNSRVTGAVGVQKTQQVGVRSRPALLDRGPIASIFFKDDQLDPIRVAGGPVPPCGPWNRRSPR